MIKKLVLGVSAVVALAGIISINTYSQYSPTSERGIVTDSFKNIALTERGIVTDSNKNIALTERGIVTDSVDSDKA